MALVADSIESGVNPDILLLAAVEFEHELQVFLDECGIGFGGYWFCDSELVGIAENGAVVGCDYVLGFFIRLLFLIFGCILDISWWLLLCILIFILCLRVDLCRAARLLGSLLSLHFLVFLVVLDCKHLVVFDTELEQLHCRCIIELLLLLSQFSCVILYIL